MNNKYSVKSGVVFRASLVLLTVAGTLGSVSQAQATCGPPDSVYIGSVCTTAANFCPRGYTLMAGQLLAISDNTALFSLLGCNWGGDCRTSFAVPDMRGRSPVGTGKGPGLTLMQLGQYQGWETHTLSVSEMPTHNHTAVLSSAAISASLIAYNGNGASPTPSDTNSHFQTVAKNSFQVANEANIYGSGTGSPVTMDGLDVTLGGGNVNVGLTGNSQAFNIRGPVTPLTHCMATDGIYPPRS
ncbi:tail fiber protein [Modicisalibacter sp. MOD 31.J]|uniref:phage tail protein n=1 Tax=Modicisalibacter sp. MOD 31.J TaxID=2831897 RepID=UPI001CCA7F95|nr:tail fiber protein [Modicisalibacter sp. MOD 31.J]MBZ9573740.1 tail fiber protein [Modicisalibacter sp. MOD 31.J]